MPFHSAANAPQQCVTLGPRIPLSLPFAECLEDEKKSVKLATPSLAEHEIPKEGQRSQRDSTEIVVLVPWIWKDTEGRQKL